MRAILLAAGLGTRLRPLTNQIAKCLVTIKGKPLLGIWLDNLTEVGLESILVNTHHLADKVEAYVASGNYKGSVVVVNEPILPGTAGTLIAYPPFFLNEDGFLVQADNYIRKDLWRFVAAHKMRSPGCVITMLTFRSVILLLAAL